MPTYAAATQVLNTVELLEHILFQLPMEDLLLDQRVSKTWKNCVDNSTKLQKALFFLPDGEPTIPMHTGDFSSDSLRTFRFPRRALPALPPPEYFFTDHDDEWTRQERRAGSLWYSNQTLKYVREQRRIHDLEFFKLDGTAINPLLANYFGLDELVWHMRLGPDLVQLDERAGRAEASWRRMVLSQPPLQDYETGEGERWLLSNWYRHVSAAPDKAHDYDRTHYVLVRILEAIGGGGQEDDWWPGKRRLHRDKSR